MEKLTTETAITGDNGNPAQEETFLQYLREAIERATAEDIDRIFPPVIADCGNCRKEKCACRFVPDAGGINPDGYLCLECFEVIMQASVARVYEDKQSLTVCKTIFGFLAIGNTATQLEN